MQKKTIAKAGVAGAVALAVSLGTISPSFADVQPNSHDAVAVGSDTVQYVADFGADGDPTGDAGYNNSNAARRVVSFDATADASGRAAYLNSSSTSLNPTVVLRAGTKPVVRPNGSGAGIAALLADSAHAISFVRSSRLPKASEEQDSRAVAFGGIHVFQIADDGLQIAVANVATTDVPAGLSAAELVKIYGGQYKTWGDVPGYTGPNPSHGIVPILPQLGSGTRNDFLADLKAQTGVDLTVAGALGANVKTSEEHDPTALTIASGTDVNGNAIGSADTIAPFSTGRDALIDTGYFGTTPAPNTINLLPQNTTAPDGAADYFLQRHLYFLARQNDVTSTTSFQTTGPNLVNALFGKSTSWYSKSANAALLSAAGVTQDWADLQFTTNG